MNGPMERKLSQAAQEFLAARGLDVELCERLGLYSGQDRNGVEWLAFPYERNAAEVNTKYRRIDNKAFRQKPGGEQCFWRFDCLTDAALAEQPLVITEGEFDAIASIQAGHWRTVSVPGGAPPQPSENPMDERSRRFAFLNSALPHLEEAREIIIAADADGPGAALLSDLQALLGPARCKWVRYPPGCKDLNDVLKARGEEGVREVLANAQWVAVAGVFTLDELPPLPALTVWRPRVLDCVDRLLPICPGHVSVWTGLSGHGKSTLVNNVMWSIADRYDLKVAAATFESTPQREYMHDLIAFRCGRAPGDQFDPATQADVEEGREWAREHIVFLHAEGVSGPGGDMIDATVEWFLRAAQTAIVRHGARIIVLDPWSQIDHLPDNNEREDLYVRRVLKQFKLLARAFDVHVAIVAHPAKPRRGLDGKYPPPTGHEISGAAHWFNAPDLGVTCHLSPPDVPDEDGGWSPDLASTRLQVMVWKVKFHRAMNRTGSAYAQLNVRNGRYMPAEHWEARAPARGVARRQD